MFYQILDQISDKPTSKRTALVKFLATDVYVDQIWTFPVQLLCETKSKLELSTFLIVKGSCSTWSPWQEGIKKLVKLDLTVNLKITYY